MRQLQVAAWAASLAVAFAASPAAAGGCTSGAGAARWGRCAAVRAHTAATGTSARQLQLRGGGNALGANGEAITEEQAGEELIKAAAANNIAGLDPAGLNLLIQSGAPVNYQVPSLSRARIGVVIPWHKRATRERGWLY
jgi:hypothetical protein